MMAIDLLDHRWRHAKKARGLPDRYPGLHEPRGGRVAQRMRRDLPGQPGKRDSAPIAHLDRLDGLPFPFDEVLLRDAKPNPPPHVRQEPRRQRDRRLALIRGAPPLG